MKYNVILSFLGLLILRYKIIKLLVCYSITIIGLNIFLIIAGNMYFDINILSFVIIVWSLEAAETVVVLYLFVVSALSLGNINIPIIPTATK